MTTTLTITTNATVGGNAGPTVVNQTPLRKASGDPGTSSDFRAWFRPASQDDVNDSAEILKAAYEKALASHQELNKGRRKDEFILFYGPLSMEAILKEIATAEERYAAKKDGRWRLTKAVNSGWTTTVTKINVFGSVIDTLVSTHPEYAAPVWGTIKFLFLATLQHQELASKISEAFESICDALPEIDFLANQLYPVSHIQRTLAIMYTHIIDFCIRALKWYRKATRGFFRKTWAAIKDPWALEFEDVVRQIQGTTRRIREQAEVAHQAETRHVTEVVEEVRLEVRRLRERKGGRDGGVGPEMEMGKILFGTGNPSLLNQLSILGTLPFIPERMSKYFLSIPFNPEKAYSIGTALRNRRRARGGSISDSDGIWKSVKLRDWISQPGSALVQLQGSVINADASRDFGLDIVDLMKSTGLPVAWYLGSPLPSTDSKGSMAVRDIVRSFVQQVLEQHKGGFANSNLSESAFASCSTEEDWLRLLIGVLSQLPRIALIIDSHDDAAHIFEAVRHFWNVVEECKTTTVIKMLLLTYPTPGASTAVYLKDDKILHCSISLGQGRRPGTMRVSLAGNAKGRRRAVSGAVKGGPALLRPFMLRLMDNEKNSGSVEVA
ncbi:Fc.00g001930.m01.CDS01 [Cosmosporella sp. VM-42]